MDFKVDVPEGKSGEWEIKRFSVNNKEDRISQLSSLFNSGRYTPPGKYTGLYRNKHIIMSDTPDEIRDHSYPLYHASGSVLIVGLGIGMVLNGILQRDEVKQVVVIEKSKDVLNLVMDHYNKKYPNKIIFIHADIFDWIPPKNLYWDYIWFDIWDDLCTDNLEEMTKLARRFGRKAKEKGYWGKELLQYRKKQENRYSW